MDSTAALNDAQLGQKGTTRAFTGEQEENMDLSSFGSDLLSAQKTTEKHSVVRASPTPLCERRSNIRVAPDLGVSEGAPVYGVEDNDGANLDESRTSPARPTRSESPEKAKAVLLVEDQLLLAKTIEQMLYALGVQTVWIASNTAQALEFLANSRFDYALLDVNLAGEFCDTVADQLVESQTPFAFVTGYGKPEHLADKYSASPVLQKPFNSRALLDVLTEFL